MKKYLICGATALIAGLFITSCTHDDIESRSIVEQKTQNFDAAFKSLYGEIAPGHTWGFDIPDVEPSGIIPAESQAESRAFTRDANPKANEWGKTYINVPDPLTPAQKDKVRRYFQRNRNPQGVSLDYTNFFVQDVYKGGTNTTGSQTSEEYLPGNQTSTGTKIVGSDHMDKLTAGIKEDHISNYNNAQCSTNNNVWDGKTYQNGHEGDFNFAVQHSDKIMLMENSSTDCFGFHNSQDSHQYNDKYVIIPGDVIQEWDNSSTGTIDGETYNANVAGMFFVGFDYEATAAYPTTNTNQYLVTETTAGNPNAISVHNDNSGKTWLLGGRDYYFSDWIVRITEGKKKTNDGDNNNNQGGPTNTSYKKTIAKRHVLLDKGRIFCEDLSSVKDVKEDIDFNDVVFDAIVWYDYWVKIEKNDNNEVISITEIRDNDHPDALWADISLLATGATEQVKIGDNEVHGLFEKSVKTMVNTVGASSNVFGSYEKDPITPINFQIDLDMPEDITGTKEDYLRTHITLDNIPITVFWNTNGAGRAAANLAAGNVTKDEAGNVIGMTAPHKIKVPLGTPWPAERRNIQEGFPLFPQYVQNETNPWDNKESFYLYEYNWNLLAHRDMDRVNNYFFYSDETEIITEIVLNNWQTTDGKTAPVDLGNWANICIGPVNLLQSAGLAVGDVIRFYCVKKNDGNFNFKVYGGSWESVPINGWTYDSQWGGYYISESAKQIFNSVGYIEVPVTQDNISGFTTTNNSNSAIIIQGENLIVNSISIFKGQ